MRASLSLPVLHEETGEEVGSYETVEALISGDGGPIAVLKQRNSLKNLIDDHRGWRELLAGRKFPIHESQPLCGFWRTRNESGGPWVPVAIWRDSVSGEIIVSRNRLHLVDKYIPDCWLWFAKNPIAEAVFRHHETTGKWPDDEAAKELTTMEGHNRPSDPYEALKLDITSAVELAKELAKFPVNTQADADKIGNRVDDLRKLAKKAKDAHEIEKRPHLEAGREVDGKYNPLIAEMTAVADIIKRLAAEWAQAEQRRLFVERQKAEQDRARIEAENRKRQEDAAKAIRDAADRAKAGEIVLQPFPEQPELQALPELPNTKVQIGGGSGRKIGFKEVEISIVIDYKKALKEFSEHPEIIALVSELCQRKLKSTGKPAKGCEVRIETRAA